MTTTLPVSAKVRPPEIAVGRALRELTKRIEDSGALDRVADEVAGRIARRLHSGTLKDLLSGTWLGHPAHPMLTDLPIGFWTSAFVLDVVGGRRSRDAATTLVGLGVLSAIPTAATGASDWSDTAGGARRIGLVHAAANGSAFLLYFSSWRARRRGRHLVGIASALAGAAAATVGGYLGGHLVNSQGIGVDHTVFDPGPDDWTDACAADAVTGDPVRIEVGGAPVLVIRRAGTVHAVGAVCPHRGAPLEDGDFDSSTVTCPWHASRFGIVDGALLRGPATAGLQLYDAREVAGRVEVRIAQRTVR